MSMSPTDFHDLLDDAVRREPAADGIDRDLAAGRRLLRRRRTLAAAGATLAVLAVGGTVQAVAGGGPRSASDGRDVPAAGQGQEAPRGDADLLGQCRDGNQSARATGLVFDHGTPVVEAQVRTAHQVILAIEAGDGAHWAECFVHLDDQEFAAGMTVYDASGTSRSTGYSFGGGCGLVDGHVDDTCTTWTMSTVDRVPPEVAQVRYDFGDGGHETLPAQDGYVVLNHLGELPPGASIDEMGSTKGFEPLSRITYLDASGDPIAAQASDGSGSGPDHERVGDLPLLSAYPSLRADQAIY